MAVIITPETGRHKEIGRLLLSLATHPHQVQWVTWPAAGFEVPEELYAKFIDATPLPELPVEKEPETQEPKRRRGRPRKEDASTDNDTPEEE